MEGLGLNNILDGDELSSLLFGDNNEDSQTEDVEESNQTDKETDKQETTEIDPDLLFDDGESESVGSEEENNKDSKEDTTSNTSSGTSPNFFSSIATAFAEEGIFPDLDEKSISNIKDAKSFRDAIVDQMNAGLDEQHKRVLECLNNNGTPDKIRQFEGILDNLNEYEKNIEVEGDAGDDLRKRIIAQDYLNKGFKPERVKQKVDKIFEEGTEIDEAKEALQSLKQYYMDGYSLYRESLKQEAEKEREERQKKSERIKDSIINEKSNLFSGLDLSKEVRQKAFEAISKPIYKDPKTGDTYTAVQKLEKDNSEEFLAKIGLLYALTNGFTSFNGIVDKKVRKEVKRGFSELERKINNTSRDSYGNLSFASGVSDENSFIGKGMKLDI